MMVASSDGSSLDVAPVSEGCEFWLDGCEFWFGFSGCLYRYCRFVLDLDEG